MITDLVVKRGDRIFECSVDYVKGKGYYARVFPAVETFDNHGIDIFGGLHVLILKCDRKSPKRDEEADDIAPEYFAVMIDKLMSNPKSKL